MSGRMIPYNPYRKVQSMSYYAQPRAIVPYVGRSRLQAGISLGRFAYRNRASIFKAARAVRRRWKRGIKRRRTYASRSYASKKRSRAESIVIPSTSGYISLPVKALFSDLVKLPDGTTGMAGHRLGPQVYVKGIKMCFDLFNVNSYPIEVHMAIIQMGTDDVTDGPIRDSFFRDDTENGLKSLNFEDIGTDAAYDIRYKCNSLNPDNKKIITHQKRVLGAQVTGKTLQESQYYWKFDKYFPIKRCANLEGANDTIPEKPFWYLFWAMPMDGANMPPDGSQNSFKFQARYKVYFNNIV